MGPIVSESFAGQRAAGNFAATDVTPALYRDLRRIAARHLSSERSNHTLQATALVNEAYLKLAGGQEWRFTGDVHFLSVASRVMRQVLVDHARSRGAQKRNGGSTLEQVSETTLQVSGEHGPEFVELIALDDALAALAAENARYARAIEMRYFGGMTAEETAEALGLSVHAVRHDLRFAQAWLRRRLHS
jgi:RNA polymerase sigma factor (TIGR02999 family)